MLGQELVRVFSRDGRYDILATSKNTAPRFQEGSCGYTSLDITDSAGVASVFQDFSPDVVINCAAMTEVDRCETSKTECWSLNADAVENLARQSARTGARIVQVSSDFVFDGLSGPYAETDRPNPLSFYGKSKLASENAARMTGRNQWSVVRTILLFGHGHDLSRSNFVLWVAEKLRRGESIEVVTDHLRSPTYVKDLAAGIELIVRFNKSGVYHVSGREVMSVYDMAVSIARQYDLDESLILPTDSTRFKQPAIRPLHTGFITLKAESELGYKPHAFADALDDLRRNPGFRQKLTSVADNG